MQSGCVESTSYLNCDLSDFWDCRDFIGGGEGVGIRTFHPHPNPLPEGEGILSERSVVVVVGVQVEVQWWGIAVDLAFGVRAAGV